MFNEGLTARGTKRKNSFNLRYFSDKNLEAKKQAFIDIKEDMKKDNYNKLKTIFRPTIYHLRISPKQFKMCLYNLTDFKPF